MRSCIGFLSCGYRRRRALRSIRQISSKSAALLLLSIFTAKLIHYIWTEPLIFVTLTRKLLDEKFPVTKDELAATKSTPFSPSETPVIAITVMGENDGEFDLMADVTTLIKSAVIFQAATRSIRFVVFADRLGARVRQLIDQLKLKTGQDIQLDLRPVDYPKDVGDLSSLFKPGASHRLLYPLLLPEYPRVLYLDIDTLFLQSPDLIWQEFGQFNQQQVAGAAPDTWDMRYAEYEPTHYPHPPTGLNSGMILMDLEKMRTVRYTEKIIEIYRAYKDYIFGDQDIINIYFGHFLEQLHLLPCTMNFKHNMCADLKQGCAIAKLEPGGSQACPQPLSPVRGPVLVHGLCKAFKHSDHGVGRGSLRIAMELWSNFLHENLSRFRIMLIYTFFPTNIYLMQSTYDAIFGHDINGSVPLSHSFLEHYSEVPKGEEDYCKEMLPTFHALLAKAKF